MIIVVIIVAEGSESIGVGVCRRCRGKMSAGEKALYRIGLRWEQTAVGRKRFHVLGVAFLMDVGRRIFCC